MENISAEEIYRITGDRTEIEFITDKYAEREADKAIIKHAVKTGKVISEEEKEIMKSAIKQRYSKFGKDRFIKNVKDDIFSEEYDIQVTVGNSKFDKAEMVAQLRQFLVETSQMEGVNIKSEEVAKEIAELIGIGGERFFDDRAPVENALPQGAPTGGPVTKAQERPIDRTLKQQTEREPGTLLSR
jgi:DNA gyrase/topoisomerase IV subunit A